MSAIAFRMKLKPGCAAEYRRRHEQMWPELADLLRNAGFRDYSIYLDEETSILFAIHALRPDASRPDLAAQPVMRKWWAHMADLMETEPDQRPREWPLLPMFYFSGD